MGDYIFSSESVSAGHPDKVADRISDALVDAILAQGKGVRAACETMVKDNRVILGGEMRCDAPLDAEGIVRRVIRDIGYDKPEYCFDAGSCEIMNYLGKQSADIAVGVDGDGDGDGLGAGDQGIMFGYACRETESLMPLPIDLAHRLVRRHAEVRESKRLPWLRPDAKSQVSVHYESGRPRSVRAVVFSTQHDPSIDGVAVKKGDPRVREAVIEEIIKPVASDMLAPDCSFHINPTGLFVKGGPVADCGLTGRKIIVDTYGGAAPHGGGAFSGKDPTKVDRSAAYALRCAAKSVVAAGLADTCMIQAAYAIGVPDPVSVRVVADGEDNSKIVGMILANFDLTPAGIIRELDLWRPQYEPTASHGHFGRADKDGLFGWERVRPLN